VVDTLWNLNSAWFASAVASLQWITVEVLSALVQRQSTLRSLGAAKRTQLFEDVMHSASEAGFGSKQWLGFSGRCFGKYAPPIIGSALGWEGSHRCLWVGGDCGNFDKRVV